MVDRWILQEIANATSAEATAYLHGAAHDSTHSARHKTTRFCQRDADWLHGLAVLLTLLGKRSWTYKEGRDRSVWVLETTWRPGELEPLSPAERAAYVGGYFDSEGGVPGSPDARFYIQLVQKNRDDLTAAREMLLALGVRCGALHNPSARVDPDYWRFYVSCGSHRDFIQRIGSWHPRKRARLEVEATRELIRLA